MAVEKVFWQDPYLTELNATITSVNNNIITLDKTIAFAFCGGQQSDSGTIEGYEILEANEKDSEIFYTIPSNHSLQEGDSVLIKIDWDKRYSIMKLHFAAELILELVNKNYNHPEKIGANITAEKSRVDFYWNGTISTIFPQLLDKINNIITSDLKIETGFSDIKNQRRYWKIKGFAQVPCAGTHVKRTSEIGQVALKRKNLGSGKERIEITLK